MPSKVGILTLVPKGAAGLAGASSYKRQCGVAVLYRTAMSISPSEFISNGPSCPILTALIRGVMHYNFVVLLCIIDIEIS